jgi:hypothetical protein
LTRRGAAIPGGANEFSLFSLHLFLHQRHEVFAPQVFRDNFAIRAKMQSILLPEINNTFCFLTLFVIRSMIERHWNATDAELPPNQQNFAIAKQIRFLREHHHHGAKSAHVAPVLWQNHWGQYD